MGTPPPIELANLGMADSLILMVMALVVFGPRRLPQIGRQIGKLMYEFRKASNDFKFQMEEELRLAEDAERRKKEEERQRAAALAPSVHPAISVSADAPAQIPADVPVQTIEAQADIGAIDPPAESPFPAETNYPPQDPAESPLLPAGEPTIQPPSTGEQVAASRPTPPARHYIPSESNGADSSHPATNPDSSLSSTEAQPPTESVSHHG